MEVSPIPTIINLEDNLVYQIYQLRYQSTSTTTGMYYQAAMLTQHKQTQLSKVTKLTQIKILTSIFTLKTVHPARSAITVTFMSEVKSEY